MLMCGVNHCTYLPITTSLAISAACHISEHEDAAVASSQPLMHGVLRTPGHEGKRVGCSSEDFGSLVEGVEYH